MKKIFLIFYALLLLTACTGNKAEKNADDVSDISAATDTTSIGIPEYPENNTPDVADGLFDDFIYRFMRNQAFQNQRIKFPLSCKTDGKQSFINKKDWKFDRLYAGNDVYTMLFDNMNTMGKEKDSSVVHVAVEWVYLEQERVKQYIFKKEKGKWMLTELDTHALHDNPNRDFYQFYRSFSTDTAFQLKHIENPFAFKTYDPDSYQELEGVLDVAQWEDYCPELPQKVITNINYEQSYTENKNRILVITSPSAGMSCILHFKKKQSGWVLVELDNI